VRMRSFPEKCRARQSAAAAFIAKRVECVGLPTLLHARRGGRNLFEVEGWTPDVPQGSSLLATLSFVAESLWDSCLLACKF
jgi:hypothetical protein